MDASAIFGTLAELSVVSDPEPAAAVVRAFRTMPLPSSGGPALGAALERLRDAVVAAGPEGVLDQCDVVAATILLPDFPPYSTRFGEGAFFREQDELADIAGFYRAFGVRVDPERHERSDHLSIELEFLALLCFKIQIAVEQGDPEKADIATEAMHRFLRDYVGAFLFAVAEGLRARSAPPIYLAWADVLHEILLVEHERLALSLPEPVRARIPATGLEYGPMTCLGDDIS